MLVKKTTRQQNGDGGEDHQAARSIRPTGNPNFLRQRISVRFMWPESVSWSMSGEVQHAVEQQDADFVFDGVSPFAGLGAGAVEGDGDVAEIFLRAVNGGKRQDVGGVVLAAETARSGPAVRRRL